MMNTNGGHPYKVLVNVSDGENMELSAESLTVFLDEEHFVTINFKSPDTPNGQFSLITEIKPTKYYDECSEFIITPGACNVLFIKARKFKCRVISAED